MMKVIFKTEHLRVQTVGDDDFELLEPFVAQIDDELVVIEPGFVTDFESVPRFLVWAYALIKNTARKSSTLHDYLIRTGGRPRSWCDKVFNAAMESEGTPATARLLAYAGVSIYTVVAGVFK
jgi:hypothetical protein